jgi:hypothetical protein
MTTRWDSRTAAPASRRRLPTPTCEKTSGSCAQPAGRVRWTGRGTESACQMPRRVGCDVGRRTEREGRHNHAVGRASRPDDELLAGRASCRARSRSGIASPPDPPISSPCRLRQRGLGMSQRWRVFVLVGSSFAGCAIQPCLQSSPSSRPHLDEVARPTVNRRA